jgi:hypothetical protein
MWIGGFGRPSLAIVSKTPRLSVRSGTESRSELTDKPWFRIADLFENPDPSPAGGWPRVDPRRCFERMAQACLRRHGEVPAAVRRPRHATVDVGHLCVVGRDQSARTATRSTPASHRTRATDPSPSAGQHWSLRATAAARDRTGLPAPKESHSCKAAGWPGPPTTRTSVATRCGLCSVTRPQRAEEVVVRKKGVNHVR